MGLCYLGGSGNPCLCVVPVKARTAGHEATAFGLKRVVRCEGQNDQNSLSLEV